jgi:hypothetical protein
MQTEAVTADHHAQRHRFSTYSLNLLMCEPPSRRMNLWNDEDRSWLNDFGHQGAAFLNMPVVIN